jgi:hypothetical protein
MNDDRAFLAALVDQVVSVEGIIDRHLLIDVPEQNQAMAITVIKHLLVTTPSGRQLVDHLGVKNSNQLRHYPAGCRLKFCAVVRTYTRADGTSSFGLSAPHSIVLVQPPPAMRPAGEEVSK